MDYGFAVWAVVVKGGRGSRVPMQRAEGGEACGG